MRQFTPASVRIPSTHAPIPPLTRRYSTPAASTAGNTATGVASVTRATLAATRLS